MQEDLGQSTEALATFRKAQQLYKLAETHVDCDAWEVKQNSMILLCTVGSLFQSTNQYAASERCYCEVLFTPRLVLKVRLQCIQALTRLNNRRGNWSTGAQFCQDALELLPRLPPS